MVIAIPEQIAEMVREWPANTSNQPPRDDEFARLETIRLSEWWLSTPRASFSASITSEPTSGKKKIGWHFWFELRHRDYDKPCRCFRVLIQHWKQPPVYQLQFPMALSELPETSENHAALQSLIKRTDEWAERELPRAKGKNEDIKSIDMFRPFSTVQFSNFKRGVDQFVEELNEILTPRK